MIGFADRPFETRDYLMLQRAHEVDEQDERLGMAAVHVERNDQGCSCYGGIACFNLLRDRVRVTFDERGARSMDGHKEMEITFDLDEAAFVKLRSGLQECFEGFGCYAEGDHA